MDTAIKKLEKSNVEEIFDLNMTQKGMLFHHLRECDENVFNVQLALEIAGRMDVALMKQSFDHVHSRHEVLRSVFSWENTSKPLQIVLKKSQPEFHFEDFTSETSGEASDLCDAYLERDRHHRFDLHKAAVRFGMIKISSDLYVIHITHHHILYDGWSTAILINDIFTYYNNISVGQGDHTLSNNKKNRYKEVQKTIVSGVKDEFEGQFWRQYLKDFEPVHVSPNRSGMSDRRSLNKVIATAQLSTLESFSTKHKVTKAAILFAAYGILLQKYLYASDVVFGTTVSHRVANSENVMGNFINTIPLRVQKQNDCSLLETVMNVHKDLIDRTPYNGTSYFEIKQMLGLNVTGELFDSVIVIENYPLDNSIVHGHGYRVSLRSVYENAGVPLHISVFFNGELKVEFTYDTGHFSKEFVQKFSNYLLRVVDEIVVNPSKKLADVKIITGYEKHQLLEEFNNTKVEYPFEKSLVNLFEHQVENTPMKCAVFDSLESLTYQELNSRVNRFANFLQENEVKPGSVVGLLMDRSIEFIVSAFAVLKSGGVYLPLDANHPKDRIKYMLEDSRASVLVTKTSVVSSKDLQRTSCKVFCCDALQDELMGYSDSNPRQGTNPDVYIMYTSGSTGVPKGVMGSQQGLLNRLYWGWSTYPSVGEEVYCLKTNIGFVDHVVEMFSPLLSGERLRVFSEEEVMDIEKMYSLLASDKVTRITLVPSYLKALIELKQNQPLAVHSLRYVFCSGEYLPFELAKTFYREFSDTQLVNIYGSTEVSADATYYNVERYYVEDVLKYFKEYSDSWNSNYNVSINKPDQNNITTPDINVEDIANNFRNINISDYPTSIEEYYVNFKKNVLPYSVNTASPRFIGHMTSVLPDYVHTISKLLSQLNQNLVKIETSKSFTFIEREAIAILHKLFYSFPEKFYNEHIQKLNSNLGIITSGGSTANISALLSARNKLLGNTQERGQSIYAKLRTQGYADMVLIGSRLMHYSFQKAASILGLGVDNVVFVENDANGALELEDLQRKINYCKENKLLIIALIGIAGSTETGSIDPLRKMGEIARKNDIHFHVDAAWGGLLKFSQRYAPLIDGIEMADSITFCGHKQLFLPQGISICLFKSPLQLNFNSTVANYQARSDSFDFGRVTLEGSRSGLSLCLHASLKVLGRKGYELLLDRGIGLANTFARMIQNSNAFELTTHNINIITYRYIPLKYRKENVSLLSKSENEFISEMNTRIQEVQFLKGRTFVSKTKISRNDEQIVVFRAVLSNPLTTTQDLESVLKDQFLIINDLFGEKNVLECNMQEELKRDEMNLHGMEREETVRIPIGKPIANTKVLILDGNDDLQPVGFIGEICISGPGLTPGYVGKLKNASSLCTNPHIENAIMYKTGDLGKWLPDGNIEFCGRLDDQVKIRGHRIELKEIESCLNEHQSIRLCAAVADHGSGSARIVVYYEALEETTVNELKKFLSRRLPLYMVPTYYMRLDKLPRLQNGKLDRKSLPTPELSSNSEYVEPTNEIEVKLSKVWCDVLGFENNTFGVTANFFDIGGHSLKAIILINKIEKAFNLRISLNDIFRNPTISQMSQCIEAKQWATNYSKDKFERKKVVI